jgi:hypothetical protein
LVFEALANRVNGKSTLQSFLKNYRHSNGGDGKREILCTSSLEPVATFQERACLLFWTPDSLFLSGNTLR